MSQQDYELVATQFSYYSAKVRACLQYKRLPYVELPSNFDTMFNRVLAATGEAKFPVVFCPDGEVLKDSCDIVEALDSRHPERPVVPEDGVLHLAAVLLETLSDEFFAAPFIYYRWVPEDTRQWALDFFRLMLTRGIEDPEEKAKAAEISQMVAGGIQDRVRKIGQDRVEMQEESQGLTEMICAAVDRHLAMVDFVLGDRPSLADLALMNGFFGHLYMDPCDASQFIRRHCTHLSLWMMRMHAAAGESDRGELFESDSLRELLTAVARPFESVANGMLNAVDAALVGYEDGAELPPSLGRIDVTLSETPMSVAASPYGAWKLQRLRDIYNGLTEGERKRADALLADTGFLPVCQKPVAWRLEKTGLGMRVVKIGARAAAGDG